MSGRPLPACAAPSRGTEEFMPFAVLAVARRSLRHRPSRACSFLSWNEPPSMFMVSGARISVRCFSDVPSSGCSGWKSSGLVSRETWRGPWRGPYASTLSARSFGLSTCRARGELRDGLLWPRRPVLRWWRAVCLSAPRVVVRGSLLMLYVEAPPPALFFGKLLGPIVFHVEVFLWVAGRWGAGRTLLL